MKGFIKKSNYYCWKEICDNSSIFAIFGVERFIIYENFYVCHVDDSFQYKEDKKKMKALLMDDELILNSIVIL